jgi:hypothetical protein
MVFQIESITSKYRPIFDKKKLKLGVIFWLDLKFYITNFKITIFCEFYKFLNRKTWFEND